jgi:pimeloyl-ACP methyl ester carboxylesterase
VNQERGADRPARHRKTDRRLAGRPIKMQYADVNDIRIAYAVYGSGPPLVLIMGYRLSSLAWPGDFIAALAERFTVVLFDNRGTGTSDKPTFGYEISNMARDVSGLLDHLEIARANVLGYSMGGAIAQEFVRQFPERVFGLVLCATMCGGPRAVYASHTHQDISKTTGNRPKTRCDARSRHQPPCTLPTCNIRPLPNSIAPRRSPTLRPRRLC